MADFLFCSRPRPPGELRRALERYVATVSPHAAEHHGDWGSLAIVRSDSEADPVHPGERWLQVRIGGARLPPDRASRLLEGGAPGDWGEHVGGPFAWLAVDRSGGGVVVTDPAAFIPVFAAEWVGPGGPALVLGTHLDSVAAAAGRAREIDPVSAADLLLHLTCTPPYTVFAGVEQVAAASSRRLGVEGWLGAAEAYWQPVEAEGAYRSLGEAAEALRETFAADVRAACEPFDRVGLLLSGGEDARAVLGAVPAGVDVTAFVFADWENREVQVAERVARAYGAELRFGRRHPDHYLAHLEAVASLVGSGQLFSDVHGFGFHESLGLRELPLVLGGLSSDAFLKAEHAPPPRRPRPPVPGASVLRPELVRAVEVRRGEFREFLRRLRPRSAGEWEHLWPFTMRKHAANYHGNRRLFASHEPFQSTGVVKLAAAVPQEWKRHRALFHRGMRPFLARSWAVPHARYRFPYFGRYANLPLALGLGVVRGARALATGQLRARHGPWPKWTRVLASPLGLELARRYAPERSPLAELFVEPGSGTTEATIRREWHPLRRLLLLQLGYLTSRAGEE